MSSNVVNLNESKQKLGVDKCKKLLKDLEDEHIEICQKSFELDRQSMVKYFVRLIADLEEEEQAEQIELLLGAIGEDIKTALHRK